MIPGSVQVTGFIAPTNILDIYPTHDALYGIDGKRSVADHTERDGIPSPRLRWGMEVFTRNDGKRWELQSDLSTWNEILSAPTASNGLNKVLNDIQLGGTLTSDIAIDGNFALNIGLVTPLSDIIFASNNSITTEVDFDGNAIGLELSKTSLTIANNGTNNHAVITDTFASKGYVYAADYSANFTNESLVTKRWVLNNSGGWGLNGNTVGSVKSIGTIDNFDLPFIVNNAEVGRFTVGGSFGIGVTALSARLHIQGSTHDITAYALKVQDDLGGNLISARNDGLVIINDLTIGKGAGTGNVVNSAYGVNVLNLNTTGTNVTGVGYNSLYSNTTGDSNSAFGYRTLYYNTTGRSNNAFGQESLFNNISGEQNNAFGNSTLWSNTTGSYNVAIGQNTLSSNVSGNENIGIGYYALWKTTTSSNIAIGSNSLTSNITGSWNTAIGKNSGYINLGSYNVFVGASAGFYETGSNSLYIHNGLGTITDSSTEKSSSLLYGLFDANTDNQLLSINARQIQMDKLQIGGATLTSGQLYKDTAANILANGDYVVGMKA